MSTDEDDDQDDTDDSEGDLTDFDDIIIAPIITNKRKSNEIKSSKLKKRRRIIQASSDSD